MLSEQISYALLFTIIITFLSTLTEILNRSDSRLRSVLFNLLYWLYFGIQLIGSLLATFLAAYILKDKLPAEVNFWFAAGCYSIAGVFSFTAVLSNSNINLFGENILTIQDRINKSKYLAIARATEKDLQYNKSEKMRIVLNLSECDKAMIQIAASDIFSSKELKEINRKASNYVDPELFVCSSIVEKDVNKAHAIINNKKNRDSINFRKKKKQIEDINQNKQSKLTPSEEIIDAPEKDIKQIEGQGIDVSKQLNPQSNQESSEKDKVIK